MIDLNSLYRNCTLCPRRCGIDRLSAFGFCGESDKLRLACASIHRGEEPPITGTGGSGTIFVSGCNLGCVFCQNFQISRSGTAWPHSGTSPMGRAVSTAEFGEICLALEKLGAENINIVTGSHAIPAIAAGIDAAVAAGLHIPVLWNTSSFENAEALELLRGRITRFLPDLKTLDPRLAARFFRAPAYPPAAAAAIQKMIELCDNHNGRPVPDRIIIRHLILPGFLESTRQVLAWFAEHARGKALLSLMTQYTPPADNRAAVTGNAAGSAGEQVTGNQIAGEQAAGKLPACPPARFVSMAEYETVLGWLEEFGIEDGFCQELVTGSDWLPDFNRTNPFSSELSKPVWHWREGFVGPRTND